MPCEARTIVVEMEDANTEVRENLALLIRLARAEQGQRDLMWQPDIAAQSWHAIERMLQHAHNHVVGFYNGVETATDANRQPAGGVR
jgi:hypothetical protein